MNKVKAIATADLHIDINNRPEDTKAVLNQMAKYCLKNEIKIVFVLGDVYDRRRPYNSERRIFETWVKFLSDKGITVVILAGNHDTDKDGISAVTEFEVFDLKDIKVYPNPSVVDFGNFKLFLGHFLVNGAKLGPSDHTGQNELTVKSILRKYKADLYLLGDVHKAQKLHENPDMVYVGSPERIDFGERKEIKGFTLLEANDKLNYKFIPLKTRKMIQYNVNDIHTWLSAESEHLGQDAIVKVKISCSKEVFNTINENEIYDKFKEAKSLKIEYDILEESRVRNEEISESNSPIDAFTTYAKFMEFDKETTQLGLKIIKEAE